jgi:ubiquinone/menaquinone biosynthesis C-methylase UbiE
MEPKIPRSVWTIHWAGTIRHVAPEQLESWHSREYVAQWAGEDVVADLLELPRRISAALVADAGIPVTHVVDLGAGPGAYLELFLRAFPEARGTWVDVSEAMEELGREQLAPLGDRVTYVVGDVERLAGLPIEPAEAVISSRALHHFSPESLERVYRAAFDIVTPGGFVVNLDHVGAPGDWEQVYRRVRPQFTGDRKRGLKPHRHDYPLSPADRHAEWIEAAGFGPADVPWRTFYTALVVARKPI